MDSCQRFKELISDYIEGGLNQDRKKEMDYHFKECLKCSTTTDQLKKLIQDLKELPKFTVSPDFETVLRARIRRENGLARRREESFLSSWKFRAPAYAVLASLIMLTAMTIFSQLNKQNKFYPTDASINHDYIRGGIKQSDSTNNTYFIIERKHYNISHPIAGDTMVKNPFDSRKNFDTTRSLARQGNFGIKKADLMRTIY